ncbi:MAG: purine-nucleoside phosphorylase, partial [Actinomycetota bacterium]|nr:purine-nucleoside phosphorylase [Actinomycetota bacterium]
MSASIAAATGIERHDVAVVLGSGMSDIARAIGGTDAIPFADVGLPTGGVAGHDGAMFAAAVGDLRVLLFAGRVHLHEGFSAVEVGRHVEAAVHAGCDVVVLTNAAGGISPELEVGHPCLISDHINLTGANPLVGRDGTEAFVDLSDVYDAGLRASARTVDPALLDGVYAGVLGPSYETPAE